MKLKLLTFIIFMFLLTGCSETVSQSSHKDIQKVCNSIEEIRVTAKENNMIIASFIKYSNISILYGCYF